MGNNESKTAERQSDEHRVQSVVRQWAGKSLTKCSDEPGASSGGEISRPDKVDTEGGYVWVFETTTL